MSLFFCCLLALQPSLLVPSRAANAVRSAAAPRSPLTSFITRSLLTVLASIEAVFREPASAPSPAAGIPPAHLGAYEPEPAAAVFFLSAPSAISVDSVSDSQVTLSWPPVVGATSYRVERSTDILTPYSTVGSPAGNSFPDGGLTRGNTYLYRVRALDSTGAVSPPSPVAMATAITFIDPELVGANDPLGRPATVVKAAHVNDLRLAVAGVRRAAARPAVAWQESVSSGVTIIRASQVAELRAKLDEARAALGLTTPAYTDATLQAGANGTAIKKIHFEELRSRSVSGSGVTGSGLTAYDFASARLDAPNRTGGGGVDLLSRNFNWTLPVVSLPGRAELDLGISLTYNSLVWTKSGNYMLFDSDWGWPAPGFRLGFPVVQGKFYDSQAQKDAYLLVTPSGARVSLRQTAAAGVYEAGDSSYLQLTEDANGGLTLRTTGGTRMSYRPLGGVYKCTEVKDRNGNFITVAYGVFDNIQTVTDTLGRVINFGYYADGYLKEITQTWHREVEGSPEPVTETHQWARFYYTDKVVRTNFTGLTVFGPANGQSIHALTKVKLADDSSFTFNYTTWGQVNQVAGYAADGRLLNYTSLDLPADETVAQTDCPRPTQRRDWAAYWNGDENGAGAVSEEAVTDYGLYDFASGVAKAEAPDGTLHKETYETSGWRKGLVTRADEFSEEDHVHPKKWTVLAWTQDNNLLSYQQNPRVEEMNVYDSAGSRRRTEVVYTSFGLSQDVKEYDSTASIVMRRIHTEYVADSVNAAGAYAQRRIIGLPLKQEVYGPDGPQEKLFAKVTFEYDLANAGATHYLEDAGTVAQHDGAYGASFGTRGNVCRTRRWDVTDPQNQSKSVASETGYDTNGSALFSSDALGHKTTLSYTGPNSAGQLAYPTKVTDPDNFFSTTEYNYDTGSVTRAVDKKGAAVKILYDSVGRVLKTKSEASGEYASWEYGASQLYSKQLTKVDADKPETFVMNVTDGAGRVVGMLRDHPGDGTGYAATRTEFDIMGRAARQYNPAEVSVDANDKSNARAWVPAGDDANPQGRDGWAYTSTTFDWKGRPRVTTNPDGTSIEAEYGGCGCAGNQTVTITGEGTLSADGTLRKRRSRRTSDVLGRPTKEETFNWDGTIYSSAVTEYNALNQVERVKVYQGAAEDNGSCPLGTCQLTTRSYDGHGRLKSSQAPAQARPVTYQYKDDDTLWKVFTPRELEGATPQDVTTTLSYNSRRMLTRVEYAVPAGLTHVPATEPSEFGYDAVGNRLWMTDGSGRIDYQYNTISRLQSETRQFTGLAGAYTLSYTYNLAGELTSITEGGATIEYKYNRAGRMEEVNGQGTLYAGVSSYASAMRYRAWGAVKSMNYGNGLNLSAKYNSRLLPEEFTVTGRPYPPPYTDVIHQQYHYNPDGSLRFSDNKIDDNFDRLNTYDHAGRLATAAAGYAVSTAMNGTPGNSNYDPYSQTYGFDAWNNLTKRDGVYWDQSESAESFAPTYDGHNREVGTPYDAGGNALQGSDGGYKFDAAGYNQDVLSGDSHFIHTRDGDGVVAKRVKWRIFPSDVKTTYYLKSSALGGQIVGEISSAGVRLKSYVYSSGEVLAEQEGGHVRWWHQDAHGGSFQKWENNLSAAEQAESDPTGVDVGLSNPFENAGGEVDLSGDRVSLVPNDPSGRCRVNGIAFDCARIGTLFRMDAVIFAPVETFRAMRFRNKYDRNDVRWVLGQYNPTAGGYMPVGVSYVVNNPAEYSFNFGDGARGTGWVTHNAPAGGMGGAQIAPQQTKMTENDMLIYRVAFLQAGGSYGKSDEPLILARIAALLSDKCGAAFKEAGLASPKELLQRGGVVVGPASLLFTSSAKDLGLVSEDTRAAYRNEFSSVRAQEGTIPASREYNGQHVNLTVDGRPRIFLHERAFTSGSLTTFSFDDVVTHAFMHAGGAGTHPRLGRHDLAGFAKHDEILEACK